MYAYPHRNGMIRLVGFLHRDTAVDGIQRALVDAQAAIAIESNDPAIVLSRILFKKLSVDRDLLKRGSLILLDKGRIPLDIRKHDGS